jgi:hypothetical protein
MSARKTDIAGDFVLVTFGDGTAALFDSGFLYAHRNDNGNRQLPAEEVARAPFGLKG